MAAHCRLGSIADQEIFPNQPMEERTSTQQHRPTGKYKQSMVRGFLRILRDLDPHVVPCFKHGVTMNHVYIMGEIYQFKSFQVATLRICHHANLPLQLNKIC